MATSSRDIELVIRAEDLASKSLAGVGTAIDKLAGALTEIDAATQRGESNLTDYAAAAKKIRQSLGDLLAVRNVVDAFKQLSSELNEAKAAFTEIEARLTKAKAAVEGVEKPTANLTAELKSAQAQYDRQAKSIGRLEGQLGKLATRAAEAGVDTNNLAAAETRITAVFEKANATIARSNTLVEKFAATRAAALERSRRAAEDEARNQERLARAIEQTNREQAELASFRRLGEDAERSAAGVQRLASRVDELAVANAKAGSSIREVVAPNERLTKTVGGLGQLFTEASTAVGRYSEQLRKTGQSTDDAQAAIAQLRSVQSSAASLGTLIERLQNTRNAAAGAARELRAAQSDVRRYAAEVRSATEPNEELAASLALAQQRLAAAQARYVAFGTAAAKLKTELVASGNSARNLSGQLAQLRTVAQSAAATMTQLGVATDRYTSANTNLGRVWRRVVFGEGRTALSFLQRVRGEVLSVTASYIGLFSAIQGVGSVLRSVEQREGINARLGVAFGNDNVGRELEYVREQADRLGLVLPELATAYSKLSIATASAGLSLEEGRFVFESFAEVGKVFRLSGDEIDGVFKALEQVFSKGKVQAEELRGQLGDRLPGAFFQFAKSLGIASGTLDDWLKTGQVTSEFLVLFAKQYRETVAGQLDAATNTTASSLNRLETAIFDFKLAIADSGAIEAFTEAVERLSAFFRSDDGEKFATALGRALEGASRAFVFLIDNLETVKRALTFLFTFWASVVFLRAIRALQTTIGTAKELGVEMGKVGKRALETFDGLFKGAPRLAFALKAIGASFAAGFTGFQIGTWLNDNFAIVRKFGNLLVGSFALFFKTIREIGVGAFKAIFSDETIGDIIADAKERLNLEIDSIRGGLTDEGVRRGAAPARESAGRANTASGRRGRRPQSALDAERERELLERVKQLAAAAAEDQKKAAEKAAEARIKLAETVADQLGRIETKILEEQADTLEERLALIEREYLELFERLRELEPGGGPQTDRARGLIEQLKAFERIKFEAEQQEKIVESIRTAEARVNDLIQIRDAQIAAENQKRKAGLQSEEEARLRIAEINNSSNRSIDEAARATIAMIDALKDPEARGSLAGVRADMEAILARAVELPTTLLSVGEIFDKWADGLTAVVDKFFEAAVGAGSLKDGFKAAGQAFLDFAASFLREIATMIIRQQLLNALQGLTQGTRFAQALSNLTRVPVLHSGGVVGRGGVPRRAVDPSLFVKARRYHTGGMVGLGANEVPAILQRGEEVLTRNDPRHAANGGGGSAPIKVINTIDSASVVREGLASKSGERVVLNIIQANRNAIKQALQ
jgi:tape measure domain-containing protein